MKRLNRFLDDVYAPRLHLAFSLAWFMGLGLSWLALETPKSDSPTTIAHVAAWPIGIGVLFTMLFFLRVADELKDESYDRRFNPDRPLIRGSVTHADLWLYLGASAALSLSLTLLLSVSATLWIVCDLVWALLLLPLERNSRIVRNNMLVNLAVTFPVNLMLSFSSLQLLTDAYGRAWNTNDLALILGFACAFLHFEFARKSAWPAFAQPNERLYSRALGGFGAGLAFLVWAALGVAIVIWQLTSMSGMGRIVGWLPLLSLLPVHQTGHRYFMQRTQRQYLKYGGITFLAWYYSSVAIAAGTIVFGRG